MDKVVIVDGVMVPLPDESPWSIDETQEIAEKILSESGKPYVYVRGGPYETEMDARNAYLKHVDVGDYFWWIDSDFEIKYVYGAEEELRKWQYDGYRLELLSWINGVLHRFLWYWPPMIFRKYDAGTHYALNHYTLYDGDGNIAYLPPRRLTIFSDWIKIFHHHREKNDKRIRAKTYYYDEVEHASGIEEFHCPNCNLDFKLPSGSRFGCPRCGDLKLNYGYKI